MRQIAQRLYGSHANFLRLRRYGIGTVELEAMVREQDGRCAICRDRPAKHIDHDHETGKPRAILCFGCNRGLGKFRDDIQVLRQATAYLRGARDDP